VEDYYLAGKASELLVRREHTLVDIDWKPRSGNFVRLNTDRAKKDDNAAGCAGIIRGNQGEWLGSFAKGVGNCSAFVTEMWGARRSIISMTLGF
ncbi:ribonuclease H, partial [Trifolium medium]|nr:ribonuclease H [Trifolium medium]